jgi:flagellar biosynthetic protein FlhB
VLAPGLAARLAEALRPFMERPHAFSLDAATLGMTLQALLAALGWAVLPAVLLFLVAALAGGLVQHGPIWSVAGLAPKLERISPVAGAKRLFALRSLVEFAKGVVKIVLVGAAAVVLLWPATARVLGATGLEAGSLLALLHTLALRLLVGIAALTALIAVLDSLYQRFERHKQLRMSRRDLQDEFKQTEGDPFSRRASRACAWSGRGGA